MTNELTTEINKSLVDSIITEIIDDGKPGINTVQFVFCLSALTKALMSACAEKAKCTCGNKGCVSGHIHSRIEAIDELIIDNMSDCLGVLNRCDMLSTLEDYPIFKSIKIEEKEQE